MQPAVLAMSCKISRCSQQFWRCHTNDPQESQVLGLNTRSTRVGGLQGTTVYCTVYVVDTLPMYIENSPLWQYCLQRIPYTDSIRQHSSAACVGCVLYRGTCLYIMPIQMEGFIWHSIHITERPMYRSHIYIGVFVVHVYCTCVSVCVRHVCSICLRVIPNASFVKV